MINNISTNYGKQQVGFGMSKWKNLEVLANDKKISVDAAKAMIKYIKGEAPHDGIDVVMHMTTTSAKDSEQIAAIVSNKTRIFPNLSNALFKHTKHVTETYKESNPVGSLKALLDEAVFQLKINADADIKAKKKILLG